MDLYGRFMCFAFVRRTVKISFFQIGFFASLLYTFRRLNGPRTTTLDGEISAPAAEGRRSRVASPTPGGRSSPTPPQTAAAVKGSSAAVGLKQNRNGRVQDRIVIFPHLLLKDSNDVYPFPVQRVARGGEEEAPAAQYPHQGSSLH